MNESAMEFRQEHIQSITKINSKEVISREKKLLSHLFFSNGEIMLFLLILFAEPFGDFFPLMEFTSGQHPSLLILAFIIHALIHITTGIYLFVTAHAMRPDSISTRMLSLLLFEPEKQWPSGSISEPNLYRRSMTIGAIAATWFGFHTVFSFLYLLFNGYLPVIYILWIIGFGLQIWALWYLRTLRPLFL